jgi:hypothetical protein
MLFAADVGSHSFPLYLIAEDYPVPTFEQPERFAESFRYLTGRSASRSSWAENF